MKGLLLVCILIRVTSISYAKECIEPQLNKYSVQQNVQWANADGISLTMDIYTPETGKKSYPVYVIFHGGGWLINNESIMDQMSKYMVEHGEYVICNVNYRLLPDNNNTTTMNEIIEDAFGAVLWIKDNIVTYKGDKNRIAVSGDSAGGHLAAMFLTAAEQLESDGFSGSSLGFKPTYLPAGKTAEETAKSNGLKIQAAVLNYPAVDLYTSCLGPSGNGSDGFESNGNIFWQLGRAQARGIFGNNINVKNNPAHYKIVSPIYNIPPVKDRALPPVLCAVGSNDNLTTPLLVKTFVDVLQKAGHKVEYWEHAGRPHAYLDSGSNQFLGTTFERDAPPAIDKILTFLDGVFKK